MSIVDSMLFVLSYTLTCIGIGFALWLAIGNMNNTKSDDRQIPKLWSSLFD